MAPCDPAQRTLASQCPPVTPQRPSSSRKPSRWPLRRKDAHGGRWGIGSDPRPWRVGEGGTGRGQERRRLLHACPIASSADERPRSPRPHHPLPRDPADPLAHTGLRRGEGETPKTRGSRPSRPPHHPDSAPGGLQTRAWALPCPWVLLLPRRRSQGTPCECRQGSTPEAWLCPHPDPGLALGPRGSALPAASAPPSTSGGSGPDRPLSGSLALLPATSAASVPPPAATTTRESRDQESGRGEEEQERESRGGERGAEK